MRNSGTEAEKKKKLRSFYLKKRNRMEPEARKAASERIVERLLKYKRLKTAETVFVYASYKSEVETRTLIDALLRMGKKVAVPKVLGAEMAFYEIVSYDTLFPGYQGILEPQVREQEEAFPAEGDVMVLPGVAFDKRGGRLGYGKGFYDRYLAKRKEQTGTKPVLVGLAFCGQLHPGKLPLEDTDEKIDCIITERSAIIPEKRKLGKAEVIADVAEAILEIIIEFILELLD